MYLGKWQQSFTLNGVAAVGATVTVYEAGTGVLASLFSNVGGLLVLFAVVAAVAGRIANMSPWAWVVGRFR